MHRLKFVVYPQSEVIITEGEIGQEMYFIVKGAVQVINH